jgi:molybdopterin/thiamine biosynthesis adenylyltransferase
MFHELVSRNQDLRRLVDKGYAVKFDSGHLVVRDVPYLDNEMKLQSGAFVTKLEFVDRVQVQQQDHQVFFCGTPPHNANGTPIQNLGGGPAQIALNDPALVVQRSFSNKPVDGNGFPDFFAKIESYTRIISGPAQQLHLEATPLTFRVDEEVTLGSVFKFHDTLTSRAEVGDLSKKLDKDVIAIIGLGGTGGYLLDFMVKTAVKEIRAFDGDLFHVHTAFRAPGRLLDDGELGKPKAEVYAQRYSNFRNGLHVETKFIDAASDAELKGVTFAFVCVDKGSARSAIFDILLAKKIEFIDVGMGLNRKRGSLSGLVRMTYYPVDAGSDVRAQNYAEMVDAPGDEYRANIQISELNALNAALAVLRYKQLRGFYVDEGQLIHALFDVTDLKLHGETLAKK